MSTASDAGFTLIETLVAMAVLAVAAAGFVHATAGHIDTIGRLEARAGGGWAADNALAEARLGLTPAAASLLGRTWRPAVAIHGSDDPEIAALSVAVDDGGTRVALRGFRDTAAAGFVASTTR